MRKKDVIIALDFPTGAEALEFLDMFQIRKPYVKIGMELFYAEGPSIVKKIKERGNPVFLDLKLHDIPNTVKHAMANLSGLGIDMTNVHAAGGSAMMKAALEGLTRPDGSRPLLIAVTQLTSTDEVMLKDELLIGSSMQDTIASYACSAKSAGLDGVVCSPLEAGLVKARCGSNFLAVTPGIRFGAGASVEKGKSGGLKDDQARITTPAVARETGSDFIVVGRPITRAENPADAYSKCIKDFLAI